MSFKAFLAAHDDSISDEEAVKKYAEYKLEFRRQQLNEFFTSHKDEEWWDCRFAHLRQFIHTLSSSPRQVFVSPLS